MRVNWRLGCDVAWHCHLCAHASMWALGWVRPGPLNAACESQRQVSAGIFFHAWVLVMCMHMYALYTCECLQA